jgi:hypothetical protein
MAFWGIAAQGPQSTAGTALMRTAAGRIQQGAVKSSPHNFIFKDGLKEDKGVQAVKASVGTTDSIYRQ